MNFLAHAFLAGPDPALRLGGLLGDFVKGPLPAGLPPDVAAGVRLHRRIDTFADSHPAFQRSRMRVSPLRRRCAGIMVDLFYDHFLARHWADYCDQPLADYTAAAYALLAHHDSLLPPTLARTLPYMREQDWLGSYASVEATALALDRIARRRLSQPARLAGAGAELEAHYGDFEGDFRAFLPDAVSFANQFRVSEGL